ncbi:MAG: hypothetical protein U5R31_10445 [Acidimicrobiia bacterium]|nr:hypothetical protein [Acidimicrobiia bacterium]
MGAGARSRGRARCSTSTTRRYQEERAPTWHARDVAIERCAAGPVRPWCSHRRRRPSRPSSSGACLDPSRRAERSGWPVVDVIDRRDEEPGRTGCYSSHLVRLLRGEGRVVCVLNRRGRSRLVAAARPAGTWPAATAATPPWSKTMRDGCRVRAARRPDRPCAPACWRDARLKNLRVGVGRAREELEALVGEPVGEVTGAADAEVPATRVLVGTEAVLHRVPRAAVVAFLDVDQELLAPRYRAAEQAFALLLRAARLLGPREAGGRLALQTRVPDHEVITAALHADPGRLAAAESARRSELGFPPFAAPRRRCRVPRRRRSSSPWEHPLGVDVLGPSDGRWLLRATDHRTLCDALAATPRPGGRLRVAVDPPRV